jgi:hypothetical protein
MVFKVGRERWDVGRGETGGMSLAETCGVCGNDRFWWRSKSGYQVCMRCARDAFAALELLARRRPGAVPQVQRWREQSDADAVLPLA